MTIKPWEDLTIKDDYMFKLIMRRKHICKKMLEKILKIKIADIKYHDSEKTIKEGYDSKGVRLDLYLEADNSVIVVEMQAQDIKSSELAKRTRYYQSMIDLDMLKAGSKYRELKKSVIIFLCPFDPYNQGRHIYTFKNICVEDKRLTMGDKATRIFLNAAGTVDDVTADVKAFLDYVNGIMSDDDFVKEIDEEIKKVKRMEQERVAYMTYELKLSDAEDRGRIETILKNILSLIKKKGWDVNEAMDVLEVSSEERPFIMEKLKLGL